MSAELMEEFNYLDRQPKTREAVAAESAGMLKSGHQAKASGNLGDRPTIVITEGAPRGHPVKRSVARSKSAAG
jgi:hypothetical protein